MNRLNQDMHHVLQSRIKIGDSAAHWRFFCWFQGGEFCHHGKNDAIPHCTSPSNGIDDVEFTSKD